MHELVQVSDSHSGANVPGIRKVVDGLFEDNVEEASVAIDNESIKIIYNFQEE